MDACEEIKKLTRENWIKGILWRSSRVSPNGKSHYCAIGWLAKQAGFKFHARFDNVSCHEFVRQRYGLSDTEITEIVSINDSHVFDGFENVKKYICSLGKDNA